MRSFQEALDIALYGADNQKVLEETKIPWLFLAALGSLDQNLEIGSRNDRDQPVGIPFSFLLAPLVRKFTSFESQAD